MRNEATLIRRGADLSADLKEALEGSETDAIYAIQIRRLSAEDAALFAEIRAQVKTGQIGRAHV